ncbi:MULTISPECIES: hypothetical protein [Rhodanobacter]|uniref:hypothetical protein n=1 Tax=Rhodanobacter TaxID=75309 RepID=UPI000483ADD1|nr:MULTISPECIES: hypothetical protein [Rhodanobacter]UJJ53633.1 hypothetical protein LRK53_11640 [Rhodanobacter thiooxydans]
MVQARAALAQVATHAATFEQRLGDAVAFAQQAHGVVLAGHVRIVAKAAQPGMLCGILAVRKPARHEPGFLQTFDIVVQGAEGEHQLGRHALPAEGVFDAAAVEARHADQ